MSRENLDLVMRVSRAASKRPKPDFETVNALCHPDHVFVPIPASKLGEAEVKGGRGYKTWLEETADVMTTEVELEGAVDIAPETVLTVSTMRFHGVSSGAETAQRVWAVATVTDGQITRTELYVDPAEALEAVGLRE